MLILYLGNQLHVIISYAMKVKVKFIRTLVMLF